MPRATARKKGASEATAAKAGAAKSATAKLTGGNGPELNVAMTDAEQIDGFIDKFEPATAKLTRACRARLRAMFPTAVELIYDNYNFLVFGFCSEPRASTCIVSLAVARNGAVLSFLNGASLPDPKGILQGQGKQNRFVRLPSAATLAEPAVAAAIAAAVAHAKVPLPRTGKGATVIQSISAKQRPRRG